MKLFSCFRHLAATLLTLVVLAALSIISLSPRYPWLWYTSDVTRCQVAAVILAFMYLLIIFELVNRTLASLVGASLSIAAYNFFNGSVGAEEILKWVDLDTLSLLLGMMVIVNTLGLSGVFDYVAVWAYKISKGRFWLLITTMSFITAILSALLDNVSTMLLMAPTIMKLCELEDIDPRRVLTIMIVASNIGGCATPVGDPPNLIVIGSSLSHIAEITFASFTAYMTPVVILTLVTILIYLKLTYRSRESFRLPLSERNVQRPATIGQLSSLSSSKNRNLDELMQVYSIKSKPILWRSLLVLFATIIMFFLQSHLNKYLTLGSISLFAGITLLVLCSAVKVKKSVGRDEESWVEDESNLFDAVINKIEWSTLIFFFALFIVMEVMSKLGLTLFLGRQVTNLVEQMPPGKLQSMAASTIVLWSSGIASSCLDNVPFTLAMVKVLQTTLIENYGILNGRSVVFALVLGACLGGNGTLIGASCNIVTAGISERHGFPMSFNSYFKFAAPITILTLLVSNIYLVLIFDLLKL